MPFAFARRGSPRIKTVAIVLDSQHERIALHRDLQLDYFGAGVLLDIIQGLLHDPEEIQLQLARPALLDTRDAASDLQICASLNFPAEVAAGGSQTQVVEVTWPQVVRNAQEWPLPPSEAASLPRRGFG